MNIIEILKKYHLTISTAESLTAGLVASEICKISGASNYYVGGVVSYTKEQKCNLLGLSMDHIEKYGVYSKETAEAMALGISHKTKSDLAISTTGVAGPNSDEGVEAGTVYFGFFIQGKIITELHHFEGSRNEVRQKAAEYAVTKMGELLEEINR